MAEKYCPECGIYYDKVVITCPNCGEDLIKGPAISPRRMVMGCVVGIILLLVLFLGIKAAAGYKANNDKKAFISCKTNCKIIAEGLRTYAKNNDGRYPESLSQLVPSYLRQIPTCPAARKETYSWAYKSLSEPVNAYSFYCGSENHSSIVSGSYPQYHSEHGLTSGVEDEE